MQRSSSDLSDTNATGHYYLLAKTAAYQADSRHPIDCVHNQQHNDQLLYHRLLTAGNSIATDILSQNIPHYILHTQNSSNANI